MIPKVAAVHDLSGLGRCSLTAALPVLSAMGVQACPVPTAVLTCQTGYGHYYCDDYTDRLPHFTHQWLRQGVKLDGIFTGFMASPRQIAVVEQFIDQLSDEKTLLVVDPVMADNGAVYPSHGGEMCRAMIRLSRRAQVLTPNLTELCVLTGEDYHQLLAEEELDARLERIGRAARGLLTGPCQAVMVTGVFWQNQVCNLVITRQGDSRHWAPAVDESFSGTGDLFSSVICGALVKGQDAHAAAGLATDFLAAAIARTVRDGYDDRNDGVAFEPCLPLLWKGECP